MFYITNTVDNLNTFNQVVNLSNTQAEVIKDIRFDIDRVGFNIDGDIFDDVLLNLNNDLLCNFVNSLIYDYNSNQYDY